MVCTCNATYCDEMIPLNESALDRMTAAVYVSSESGQRLQRVDAQWIITNTTSRSSAKCKFVVELRIEINIFNDLKNCFKSQILRHFSTKTLKRYYHNAKNVKYIIRKYANVVLKISNWFAAKDIIPISVHINPSERYQSMIGFGGAFTDSAGINLASLSAGARDNLLRAYYSTDGMMMLM